MFLIEIVSVFGRVHNYYAHEFVELSKLNERILSRTYEKKEHCIL